MLQQTGVSVVKEYYLRFLEAFPTIEALAAADEHKVLKQWEGLGYYSRARSLMKTAQLIVFEYGGRFPDTYEEILKLPGIGPYTAGAIASICFDLSVPAVDGNVVRVIARIAGLHAEVTEALKNSIKASLKEIYPAERRGDFTQSLMELGSVVCVPNGIPKCDACPISGLCKAHRDGTVMSLPAKSQKKAKKQQELTVFLLTCGENIALRRRESKGLLAGLWELPNVSGRLSDHEAIAIAARWGAAPSALTKSLERSHIFTHIKWDMVCYFIECDAMPLCFTWVSRRMLLETYALPTAFKKFLVEICD
jgi:A/G-specific adenine glycosylase